MPLKYLPAVILLLAPVSPAWAQRQDSAGTRRADSLRHRIEERFTARVQERLGLTDEQTARLKTTSQTYAARRRELRDQAHRIRDALRAQLQPGVAADRDSVTRLTDAMVELKLRSAQATRDEMKEVSAYLTPVQRARFYLMRGQLSHHVREAHEHRERGRRERHRSWM
jgi:hypothetical protein